jgi:hypothetical protein
MQLRNARLCLDCDEIHEEPHCPICASESFAFIKRWVPQTERRARQRPPDVDGEHRETIDTYKELLAAGQDEPRLTTWQLVRGGAVSLAILGAAGWMWRRNAQSRPAPSSNGDASGAEHTSSR